MSNNESKATKGGNSGGNDKFLTQVKVLLGFLLLLLSVVIVALALKPNSQVTNQTNATNKEISQLQSKTKSISATDGTELPDNEKLNATLTAFMNDAFKHNQTDKDTKYGTAKSYQAVTSVFDGGDPDGQKATYTVKKANLKFTQSASGWSGMGTIDVTEKAGESEYPISYTANVTLAESSSGNLQVSTIQLGTIGGNQS